MSTVTCPFCEAKISLEDEKIFPHEVIQCEECGTELEITSVNPIELQLAPDVEEDWGE